MSPGAQSVERMLWMSYWSKKSTTPGVGSTCGSWIATELTEMFVPEPAGP